LRGRILEGGGGLTVCRKTDELRGCNLVKSALGEQLMVRVELWMRCLNSGARVYRGVGRDTA